MNQQMTRIWLRMILQKAIGLGEARVTCSLPFFVQTLAQNRMQAPPIQKFNRIPLMNKQ